MGQYWLPVNLDKREFVDPHKLGAFLKLIEQVCGWRTGAALIVLLAAEPEERGGGDLRLEYPEAREVVGRWAGDRVALVGDYAERRDLPEEFNADCIWDLCMSQTEEEALDRYQDLLESDPERAERFWNEYKTKGPYKDISNLVRKVLEVETGTKFEPL